MFGVRPEEALEIAAGMSTEHFLVFLNGQPAAAWGYASHGIGSATAYGWLLTSPLVEECPLLFLRESKKAVQYILRRALRLEVTVLPGHTTSIHWLKWLGFLPCGETPHFLTFERTR
jgi:hypothetical protein